MFLILSIIIFVLLFSWVNFMKKARQYNIRGPVPFPLIGNGHLALGNPTKFLPMLQKLNENYGDAVRVHFLYDVYVILYHPKYIEELISNVAYIDKGRSYRFLLPWLGQGLLTTTGSRWKVHRKFLTPAFHFNILQNFLPVFLRNEKILIKKLSKFADGTNFDLFPVIALCALDNVSESIMGVSFNAQKDNESKYVKAINYLSSVIASRMRNPFFGFEVTFNMSHLKVKQDKALKILHSHTTNVIESRRRELATLSTVTKNDESGIGVKNKHAFLDLLLLAEVDGKTINDESIREEVETFMFEGYDTTTVGIAFCLYCISKFDDVQDKILNEQKLVLGDDFFRDPSYNELKQMKYLEMVIKESLRLYPSVPLIERMIRKDVDISGLHLRKDTTVVINIFHMQRNPAVYKDPEEFRPERFEAQNDKNPFSWLAFSAGPRNCIGQKFAMMEMKVTIASVIKHFKLLPSNNVNPNLYVDLILRSDSGVHVRFKPRL